MWSITRQTNVRPDFEMVECIIHKLNCEFDAYDLWHHSTARTEMFEFKYYLTSLRDEAWEILFMDKCVASGGGGVWGADYDDFHESDYITLTKDNKDKIYEMAYNGAIGVITDLLNMISYAHIDKSHKENWIDIINKGITRVEEDNK